MKYITLCLILLTGCSTGSKKITPPSADYVPPLTDQLTTLGESSEAVFSPDSTKLIFQSKKRSLHENTQVYIIDINSKVEKRLTHNDGDDTCPTFSPDGKKIIYASTTDEIKERAEELNSEPNKSISKKFLPYEIYSANLDGSHIRRLTHQPGYDAEASFFPGSSKLVFTSLRSGELELFAMSHEGRNITRLTNNNIPDSSAQVSPNGKLMVWVSGGHIYISNTKGTNVKQVTTGAASYSSPVWHPDGKVILFSSNKDDKDNYELYQINTDGTCIKRLTYDSANDLFPAISLNKKKVAYTSNKSGKNQIHMMDYTEPRDCSP